MLGVRGETHPAHERMCLSCGRRGPEFQGDAAHGPFECPSCHADLYARPPRSYAEMEGLRPEDPSARWSRRAPARSRTTPRPEAPRVAHRLPLSIVIIAAGAVWAVVSLAALTLS